MNKTGMKHISVRGLLCDQLRGLLLAAALVTGPVYGQNQAQSQAPAKDPTLSQVYEAAQAGKLGEAQAMMDKVLRDHPNSGKAHFVEAELLGKQGRYADAQAELDTARRLAPGLPFAKPEAVQKLQSLIEAPRRLQQERQIVVTPQAPASPSLPWGMLILGGGAMLLVFFIARRFLGTPRAVATPAPWGAPGAGAAGAYGPSYGNPAPMNPGGGMMGGQPGSGMGSGIMGGLATGAAVGVGVVAGEALARHFMDGGTSSQSGQPQHLPANNALDNGAGSGYVPIEPVVDDMGGNDFGVSDSGSWDDGGSSGGGGGDDWN